MREEAYETEQRRYEIFAENLKKSDKEVADRLQKTLKGRDVNAEDRDRTLAAEQSAARLQLWQDYQRGKLERAQQTQAKLDEIEQQALQGDKTNYEARLRLSAAAFERRRKDLERENAANRFPTEGGQTYQQALDLLNASQQQAQANILIDAAKAIVENVTARREAELKEVRARLSLPGANPAEI